MEWFEGLVSHATCQGLHDSFVDLETVKEDTFDEVVQSVLQHRNAEADLRLGQPGFRTLISVENSLSTKLFSTLLATVEEYNSFRFFLGPCSGSTSGISRFCE